MVPSSIRRATRRNMEGDVFGSVAFLRHGSNVYIAKESVKEVKTKMKMHDDVATTTKSFGKSSELRRRPTHVGI